MMDGVIAYLKTHEGTKAGARSSDHLGSQHQEQGTSPQAPQQNAQEAEINRQLRRGALQPKKPVHVLGTLPYRWEAGHAEATLVAVTFDALDILVLDGPALHDAYCAHGPWHTALTTLPPSYTCLRWYLLASTLAFSCSALLSRSRIFFSNSSLEGLFSTASGAGSSGISVSRVTAACLS